MRVTMAELARIAAAMGHADLNVFQTGNGTFWVCTCSCGYRSTRRHNAAAAAQAAAYHLEKVSREFSSTGLTVAQLEARNASLHAAS